MNIRILTSLKQADKAEGITVVIDVLRAFTTTCYVFASGAKRIISVADLDEAYAIKKLHPDYILMGERKGIKQQGFDYGNSPADLTNIALPNNTVVLTTSAGTQGIQKAIHADEVLTGAFVNAAATADYIRSRNPGTVTLLCTDDWHPENEDVQCAKYLQSLLEGLHMDFAKIQMYMRHHPSADGFLLHPLTPSAPKDFALCLSLDTFDFAVKATKKEYIYLERL